MQKAFTQEIMYVKLWQLLNSEESMLHYRCSTLKKTILATAVAFALSGCIGGSSDDDDDNGVAANDGTTEGAGSDSDSSTGDEQIVVGVPIPQSDPTDDDDTENEVTDTEVIEPVAPGSDDTDGETMDPEMVSPVDDGTDNEPGDTGDTGETPVDGDMGENGDPAENVDPVPGDTENPETPETPENPENPETPVTPENPENPETPDNSLIDTDGDGVTDVVENEIGINPNNPDTDGDGFEDGIDVFPNDPTANADSDGDGVDDSRDEFPNDASETADLNGDGLGDNANPIDGAILSGTITNASNSSVVEGATVNLDLIGFDSSVDVVNRTTANADGVYQLVVDASLVPDSFIITASSEGFRPAVIIADSDDYTDEDVLSIDIALTPVSDDEVIIESVPVVHHLGDDSFSGAANSQFQRSSEGPSYIRNFSLSDEQISSLQLTLVTAAKGVQNANEVYINSVLVGTFPDTNTDGSYTLLEIPLTLEADLLVTGSNTVEIRSVASGVTVVDIDDFEFVNISISGFTQ